MGWGQKQSKAWRRIAEENIEAVVKLRKQVAEQRDELVALRRLPTYPLNAIIERLQNDNGILREQLRLAERRDEV